MSPITSPRRRGKTHRARRWCCRPLRWPETLSPRFLLHCVNAPPPVTVRATVTGSARGRRPTVHAVRPLLRPLPGPVHRIECPPSDHIGCSPAPSDLDPRTRLMTQVAPGSDPRPSPARACLARARGFGRWVRYSRTTRPGSALFGPVQAQSAAQFE